VSFSKELLQELIGFVFLVGLPPQGIEKNALRLIKHLGLRHFIFFERDFGPGGTFWEIKNQISPLLLAVDQEGGPVTRLKPPLVPKLEAPLEVAKASNPLVAVRHQALSCLKGLKQVGLNFNLAPVLDLADHKAPAFLRARTFGQDPQLVAKLGREYVKTFLQHGVLCCAKHFPGLGGVILDPHLDLPRTEKINPQALRPFFEAIGAGVPAIMTTHLVVDDLGYDPVTFSPQAINILRGQLGFKGLILTDDLNMGAIERHFPLAEAVLKAFEAGHDLVLICQDFHKATEAIKIFRQEVYRSKVLQGRIFEAACRIRETIQKQLPLGV